MRVSRDSRIRSILMTRRTGALTITTAVAEFWRLIQNSLRVTWLAVNGNGARYVAWRRACDTEWCQAGLGMRFSRVVWLTTDGVICAACIWLLVAPGGPVRQRWQRWEQVSILRRSVREQWGTITHAAVSLGRATGPPTLVEVMDYQCPYCRAMQDTVLRFRQRHPGVGVAILQYPLSSLHPAAREAAIAAICTEQQGVFARLHEVLLEDDAWFLTQDWTVEARRAGVADEDAFTHCMNSEAAVKHMTSDSSLVDGLGLNGTPVWLSLRGVTLGTTDVRGLERLAGME